MVLVGAVFDQFRSHEPSIPLIVATDSEATPCFCDAQGDTGAHTRGLIMSSVLNCVSSLRWHFFVLDSAASTTSVDRLCMSARHRFTVRTEAASLRRFILLWKGCQRRSGQKGVVDVRTIAFLAQASCTLHGEEETLAPNGPAGFISITVQLIIP
uniref:Uncharacterized protein n=2 Tax=Eutreptiella gymnastica TaxID=73025 RepID=A0A7S1IQQ2_9EUGL